MVTIVNISADAIIILPVTHNLVNVFVTRDGQVMTALNHVPRATTVWDARNNVQILFMETRHVIT